MINNFKKPTATHKRYAQGIIKALDKKYDDLSQFDKKKIFAMVKLNTYDHALFLETIQEYKEKGLLWVCIHYTKKYETKHKKTILDTQVSKKGNSKQDQSGSLFIEKHQEEKI